MAYDDDKSPAGDDPWAGLEADSQPGSEPDFTFSFDDDAAADGQALNELMAEEPAAEQPVASEPPVADPFAEESQAEELVAEAIGFGAADAALDPAGDAALDALLDDGLEAAADPALDSLLAAEAPQEDDDAGHPDVIPAADVFAGAAAEGPADADIDDWLNEPANAEASASSVLGSSVFHQSPEEGGEMPDFAAGESTVNIGTGTSGIVSPSGIAALSGNDMFGEPEPPAAGEEIDPFAGLTAEGGDDWPAMEAGEAPESAGATAAASDSDDMFSFMGQADSADDQEAALEAGLPAEATVDEFASGFGLGAGAAVAGGAAATAAAGDDAKRGPTVKKRPAPPRKKKPSVIGQLVGVVLGGAMAIPVTMAILIWGFGRDPFNLTPMLPDSVAFLLPAKFRPAGSSTIPNAPSLDDIVGTPAGNDGEAALPNAADLTTTEPPTSPVEPEPTDVAVVDPAAPPAAGESADDPLMNLLDETGTATPSPAAVEPPAPPEPEPLDLEKLGAVVAESTAALEAVAAVEDPADPVRKRLLAKWYRSLAGYAEELAALERLATETSRPFEPAIEQGDAIRAGLADHPQLLAELSRLTRDWIAYAKRPSDGVVTPATFVGARRVGPYWRSQVSLAATDTKPAFEMVVLTRTEPSVAPGDEVVITGLAVDDNVVWASELKAAAAGTGFPGL
jgi:hypothetical protein